MNKPLLIQFNQWKIGTRLGVGFSLVLFLFILVSIFNWNSRNDNQRAFVLYSQISEKSTAILEVDYQITYLQSAILAYSQTGHKAGVARIKDLYAKLQKKLTSIRPYFADADHQSLLVKMNSVLSTYNEIIDTLFADRKRYDQYTKETLPQAANDVRKTLENLLKFVEGKNYPAMQSSIKQITEHFLSALVDVNSFFAVRNYALQRSAKTSLAEAVKIWSELQNQKNAEELQVLLKDLGMTITTYTAGFNQAIQVTRGYLFLVNVVIPGEAAEFENLSLSLKEFTLKNLEEVATSTEKNVRDNQQKTSIMAAVGIVFGVILAFFISKSIVTPLQTISATFRQLIKRERVDRIPGLDRKDEIGQLAKAADVFRVISENRFQSIFDEAPIGIALIDSLTGDIQELNPKFAEIAGRPLTEMTEIDWISITHPDDVQEDLDNMALLNAGEITGFTMNKRYIRPDGSHVWINMFIVPVKGDDKSTPCHLCMIEDITERKLAEEEKNNLESRLQQAQKMEAIGTLAGGIAHDFNNILGAIIGYTEMARDDSPKESSVVKDLDKVLKASDRAASLVKQILAFSRQSDIEFQYIQPASIVKEAINMLRPSLPATIKIIKDVDSATVHIFADPSQFSQIVMNLCTNAFHAMEEKGGRLSLSLREVVLNNEDLMHEQTVTAGTFVQLSICDSGPGMTEEVKNKIFNPYFTTKEIGKGTGMGLSIVHGIVKGYGGFITCNSELGKGTDFQLFFPVLERAALHETEEVKNIPAGKENILFIDDEEILAEMGKHMLERLGYHVTVRKSSLEALETFQNQPDQFDVVITDQTMPGMTGVDLARRMLQIRPDIPIILCTGYSSIISEEKAKSFGIREFALKPVGKSDIAMLIRKVLDT